MKGCKSIAEYAIRRWLEKENFVLSCFELELDLKNNMAYIRDEADEELRLVYDRKSRCVYVAE